jgi:hypothetical protein
MGDGELPDGKSGWWRHFDPQVLDDGAVCTDASSSESGGDVG